MPDDVAPIDNVVKLEPDELCRVKETAESLADQSELERSFWLPKRAEAIGVAEKMLKSAVHAVLKQRAMCAAAERLEQGREQKRQEKQHAAEERKDREQAKEEARERQQAKK